MTISMAWWVFVTLFTLAWVGGAVVFWLMFLGVMGRVEAIRRGARGVRVVRR